MSYKMRFPTCERTYCIARLRGEFMGSQYNMSFVAFKYPRERLLEQYESIVLATNVLALHPL
jgi:hypothetical protein